MNKSRKNRKFWGEKSVKTKMFTCNFFLKRCFISLKTNRLSHITMGHPQWLNSASRCGCLIAVRAKRWVPTEIKRRVLNLKTMLLLMKDLNPYDLN